MGKHARDLCQLECFDTKLPLPLPHNDTRASHKELHGVSYARLPETRLRQAPLSCGKIGISTLELMLAIRFIYKTYPLGSFDTRPLNFSDVSATLQIRRFLLDKIFQTFPDRKFVLMGDTTNSDVMKAYPALAHDYPGQVQCIFLRNTSATDSTDLFPYDTSGFEGLNQTQYMVSASDFLELPFIPYTKLTV